ncbi:helix-turn-helix domain-containing protein [Catenulispora yoronensis]
MTTIAWSPAITTGDLADSLGLSPATASRHATVLRGAGLIDTMRDGQAVRHQVTRLGRDLIADADRA